MYPVNHGGHLAQRRLFKRNYLRNGKRMSILANQTDPSFQLREGFSREIIIDSYVNINLFNHSGHREVGRRK